MNIAIKKKPLFFILINPKKTFPIIFNKENKYIPLLYIVGCIWISINKAMKYSSETYLESSFIVSLLLSIATSWLLFYLTSVVLNGVGNKLGGKVKTEKSMVVLFWSFVPGVIAIIASALAILLFGTDILREGTATGNLFIIRNILIYINFILGLWSIYILIKGIMLIHSISTLKAVLTIILPLIIIYISISLIS
jgi:hypothetical protein